MYLDILWYVYYSIPLHATAGMDPGFLGGWFIYSLASVSHRASYYHARSPNSHSLIYKHSLASQFELISQHQSLYYWYTIMPTVKQLVLRHC